MNYLFTYTGIQLCENCLNKQSCLYSSQSFVTQCEEHEIEIKKVEFKEEKNALYNTDKITQEEYKGICTTCDYVKNCSLREENELILSCEHYK